MFTENKCKILKVERRGHRVGTMGFKNNMVVRFLGFFLVFWFFVFASYVPHLELKKLATPKCLLVET